MNLRDQVYKAAFSSAWPINQWNVVTLEQGGQKIRVQARINQKSFVHIRKISLSRKEAKIRLQFFRINTGGNLIAEGETNIYASIQPELYKTVFDEIRAAFS